MLIGVTGSITAGKSTGCKMLQEFGAQVIDADKLGHQCYLPGTESYKEVIHTFGQQILNQDGTVDRKALGTIVFNDPSQLKKLTDITWPAINNLAQVEFKKLKSQGAEIVIIEAAVLIESKLYNLCDEVWAIVITPEVAIQRLAERNNMTKEEALKRINTQLSNEERSKYANVIIYNQSTIEEFRSNIAKEWKSLQARKSNILCKI